jgi:hypothetical protein
MKNMNVAHTAKASARCGFYALLFCESSCIINATLTLVLVNFVRWSYFMFVVFK